jgi:hypothetical protein
MTTPNKEAAPTFSMQPIEYPDGSWGVTVYVTGLATQQQAEAAMNHMQRLFCGAEIKEAG